MTISQGRGGIAVGVEDRFERATADKGLHRDLGRNNTDCVTPFVMIG